MPEPSGPTALLAPGYPLVLAGIFLVFGVYSVQSAVVAYLINCLFSALTCIALYKLGDRLFGREVGLAAAALLALYPPSIWHSVNTIWDTTLTGLALVVLVTWLYGLPERPGTAQLLRAGLLMGFVAFLNPALLSFYPVVALVLWLRIRKQGSKGYREIAILTGSCLLVCVPWMVRNRRAGRLLHATHQRRSESPAGEQRRRLAHGIRRRHEHLPHEFEGGRPAVP